MESDEYVSPGTLAMADQNWAQAGEQCQAAVHQLRQHRADCPNLEPYCVSATWADQMNQVQDSQWSLPMLHWALVRILELEDQLGKQQ